MRIVFRIVSIALVLVIAYPAYTAFRVWRASMLDQAQPADAIVVLGAAQYNGRPSPVLQARLDHAANLWQRKLAPRIVVTGGRVEGDAQTEAAASAGYLARRGVPDNAVLREVQGRTSWQSLQAAARFMRQRDIEKVILVSDPFHSARVATMAEELGLEPLVSPTRTSPIGGRQALPYYVKEVASISVGELFGFGRLADVERTVTSTPP